MTLLKKTIKLFLLAIPILFLGCYFSDSSKKALHPKKERDNSFLIGLFAMTSQSGNLSSSQTPVPTVVETPSLTPAAGTYNTDQIVTLSTTTSGASIHYTLDGSEPTSSSTQYTTPISVAGNGTSLTIKAIAIKSGMKDSSVTSGGYVIDYGIVVTPTMSPGAGTHSSDQSVSLSTNTSGATIYYTTNGTDPTTSSTQYTAPISVAGNGTTMNIKAFAVKAGLGNSSISSGTYTIAYATVATPTFGVAGGTYDSDQSVSISTSTSGTTIYYTTNGTDPTTGSTQYTGPISVAGHGTSLTIKALAVKTGMVNSAIGSAVYTISYGTVSTPTFGVAAGTYNSDQSVSISTSTSGTTIYYTTNGTDPTTGSTQYTGSVSIAGHGTSLTLKAIAVKTGMLNSAIASSAYTITYSTVATPTFSLEAGTYTGARTITLSTTTTTANIYYTTNGDTPTCASTMYGSSITVSTVTTVKAIACKSGMLNSAVASATYTIQYTVGGSITGLSATGLVLRNNGGNSLTVNSGDTSFTFSNPINAGSAYAVTVQTQPTGLICTPSSATGTVGSANVTSVSVACVMAAPTFSPVAGTYTGSRNITLTALSGATIHYTTNGSTPTCSSTTYVAPVTVESVTTIKAIACMSGMSDSAVGTAAYIIQYAVGGTITGGSNSVGVVIRNNAGNSMTLTGAPSFTFTTPITSGSGYNVTAQDSPCVAMAYQNRCTVTSGSGTVGTANVMNVQLSCSSVLRVNCP
jgi:hypothetical protein